MERIEFHCSPDGNVYFRRNGTEPKRLTKFETEVVDFLHEMIKYRFPEAYTRLAFLYRGRKFEMIDRFVRCNFGEQDFLSYDVDNVVLNFEEVRCPLRGICENEGIICKPQSTVPLSESEKEIVNLYLQGYSFSEIAGILTKNQKTVKAQLYRIKTKLGVRNCREIIKVLRMKNYK